jgi:Rrf2 family protein
MGAASGRSRSPDEAPASGRPRPAGLRTIRVPARVDCAVRALLVLARAAATARQIGRAEGISYRFLSSVLTALGSAGIVEARVGADGGYRLARPAEAITVADVFVAVDARAPSPLKGTDVTRTLWADLEEVAHRRLVQVSLADLGAPARGAAVVVGDEERAPAGEGGAG